MYSGIAAPAAKLPDRALQYRQGVRDLSDHRSGYSPEQLEKLRKIHARLIESRRELDALIGDAYLRPRANIVPVHFLDLASAVEKLRWAEKEWRELDKQLEQRHEAEDSKLVLESVPADPPSG